MYMYKLRALYPVRAKYLSCSESSKGNPVLIGASTVLGAAGRGRGRCRVQEGQLSAGRHRLALLPALLARIELVEAVANDGDGQGNDQDPKDGAETAENLPKTGYGAHVPVPHLQILYR